MKLSLSKYRLLVPLIALVMRVISVPTANLSYLLLAVYALKGRMQALQALTLTWLFLMLNPAIVPNVPAASIGRYGVLFSALVAIMVHKPAISGFRSGMLLDRPTLLLGVFFISHSLVFSPMIDISLLKAISWTLTMSISIAGWSGMSGNQRELLINQLYVCLVAIMALSLPMIAMPAGYMVNGTGFQGILGHPQGFGLIVAVLGAWAGMRMVALPNPPWRLIMIVSLCLGLVVLSETRTGAFSLVLSVAIAIMFGPVLAGRPVRHLMPGLRSSKVHLVIALSLTSMIIAWPLLVQRSDTFIAKRGEASNLVEAYEMSRGGAIEVMWQNIQENPWQGIGFGLASVPELMVVKRDPFLNLPISALVEKGVMPISVLEEVGIPGFMFFAGWLWIMLRRSARAGLVPLALFLVILLINLGEATLFSPGGAGLLTLILIGWGVTNERVETRHL